MYSSKLSVVTWTSCTNGSNLRLLELANSTKVYSETNLGRRLKSLVKAESAVGNLLMWLVATVLISPETFKSAGMFLFQPSTPGQGRRLLSFSFHFRFFTLTRP